MLFTDYTSLISNGCDALTRGNMERALLAASLKASKTEHHIFTLKNITNIAGSAKFLDTKLNWLNHINLLANKLPKTRHINFKVAL